MSEDWLEFLRWLHNLPEEESEAPVVPDAAEPAEIAVQAELEFD